MDNIILNIFRSFLGEPHEHNEESGQTSWDCPACAEDKGLPLGQGDGRHKLAINYKRGIFKCWVCNYQNNMYGKIPKLIKRYGNKKILKDYLLLKPENDYQPNLNDIQATVVHLPDGFKKLSECTGSEYKYSHAYYYLIDRGFTDEIIKEFNIGFTTYGKFRNRVIIPSYDEVGDLNYFVGRAWDDFNKPKYNNPDAEKQAIIFNEDKINWDVTIYLVEGAFDHIVIPNSIPILGKNLSVRLKQMILTKSRADIVILLDEDAYDDAIRIYKELNVGDLYNKIKLCTPPYKEDPASIFKNEGRSGIIKLLKTSKRVPEIELY
jgi:DNA primase